jgi:hypothetical protein
MWRARAADSRRIAEIKDLLSVVAAIAFRIALIVVGGSGAERPLHVLAKLLPLVKRESGWSCSSKEGRLFVRGSLPVRRRTHQDLTRPRQDGAAFEVKLAAAPSGPR